MTAGEFVITHVGHLVGLAALIVCSGFFAGSETALFSLSRAQLLRFATGQKRVGHVVASLMRRPQRLLMVILLSNQLVNVAFFAVSAALVFDLQQVPAVGRWLHVVLLFAPLLLIILLGEVCPKSLAVSAPAGIAQLSALPLAVLVRLLNPVQLALNAFLIGPLTRLLTPRHHAPTLKPAELAGLLELSGRRGMITANESAWLQEVIGLSGLKVTDIMVPRVDVTAYDVDAPPAW